MVVVLEGMERDKSVVLGVLGFDGEEVKRVGRRG